MTLHDVKEIVKRLPLEGAAADDDLCEDVACIVYRTNRFDYGGFNGKSCVSM